MRLVLANSYKFYHLKQQLFFNETHVRKHNPVCVSLTRTQVHIVLNINPVCVSHTRTRVHIVPYINPVCVSHTRTRVHIVPNINPVCVSHTRTLPRICPSHTDTHRHRCPLYAHNGQNISAIYTTIKGNQSNNCAHCTMKISYFRTIWTRVRV